MTDSMFDIQNGVLLAYHGEEEAVVIPEGVETIGKNAFYKNTSLKVVEFPSNLSYIDDCAFYDCVNLEKIIFNKTPETLTIDESAFTYYFFYNRFDFYKRREIIIRDFKSWCETDHEIVGKYQNGQTMKSLFWRGQAKGGAFFFFEDQGETTLALPEGVKKIGKNTFNGIPVEWITLPDGIETIGDYAFRECPLASITLPASLRSIGKYAFYKCPLPELTLPDGIETIGDYAFYCCKGIRSLVLPDSLTKLGISAFSGIESLATVTMTASVKNYENAFSFTALTEVVVPEGVENLDSTFSACPKLLSVTLPSTLKSCTGTFLGCPNLIIITLPDALKTIGASFAKNCASLTEITIPDSVTKIEKSAFEGCKNLTAVKLPRGLRELEYYAFQSTAIRELELPGSLENWEFSSFSGCEKLTSVVIGEGVTKVPKYALQYCTSLSKITLPSTLETLEDYAFAGCDALTQITLPTSLRVIEGSAFTKCQSLTSVVLPEGLTELGWHAFEECQNLKEVTLPETLVTIQGHAFENCVALEKINLPASLEKIGESAFMGCTALRSVAIPAGVKVICEKAFRNCTALSSLALTAVERIEDGAFSYCESLTRVRLPDTLTYLGEYAFFSCDSLAEVIPPRGIVTAMSNAFSCCKKIKEFPIPKEPYGFSVFDASLNLPYDQLPEAEQYCYQPASEGDEGAQEVRGIGFFAKKPYAPALKDHIIDTCNTWVFHISSSHGISQDHDSGIHDVEHHKHDVNIMPSNCVVLDNKVIGFIDSEGRDYLIASPKNRWIYDKGYGSTVDYTDYGIAKRKR